MEKATMHGEFFYVPKVLKMAKWPTDLAKTVYFGKYYFN
jgi:hypothetical protein